MARRSSKPTGPKPVETYRHDEKRANIPTNELRGFVEGDESAPSRMLYPRDPSLDPQLVWKGKDEQDAGDLEVPVVPIYIQEKILPQVIIENLRDTARKGEPEPELTLFNDYDGIEFQELVEFYRHEQNWANRMILGDSLLVMTSLAEKEGLKGKVQMIYMDPPYGIKFGSNWQVSTRKRDVKDGKAEDATRQPEQIKAFRDTWELGIHSYLAYLRDRLIGRARAAHRERQHLRADRRRERAPRALRDGRGVRERELRAADDRLRTTSGAGSFAGGTQTLAAVSSYLVWYAKDCAQREVPTAVRRSRAGGGRAEQYTLVELPDGS